MPSSTVYLLFSLFFMLHELEETAFMPHWAIRQRMQAKPRKKRKRIPPVSARDFTLMVLEEYILLLGITGICMTAHWLAFYQAIMIVYNLHIIIHIIQAITLKSYVPGLWLGILSMLLVSWLLHISWHETHLTHVAACLPPGSHPRNRQPDPHTHHRPKNKQTKLTHPTERSFGVWSPRDATSASGLKNSACPAYGRSMEDFCLSEYYWPYS